MLESAFNQLKLSEETDDFEKFLLLLEQRKKQGQNYVIMKSIPKRLHYRLVKENFIIKREEIKINKFIFFKKSTLHYVIRPSN
ncbi:hypothetical protein ACKUSY_05730 [Myroides odoratus]